jgi:hypothetical protein
VHQLRSDWEGSDCLVLLGSARLGRLWEVPIQGGPSTGAFPKVAACIWLKLGKGYMCTRDQKGAIGEDMVVLKRERKVG